MKWIDYPGFNDTLNPHPNDVGRVGALPIFRQATQDVQDVWNNYRKSQGLEPQHFPIGPTCVISAWQPNEQEYKTIAAAVANGEPITIFLQFSGATHSPVSVWGTSPWQAPEQEPTAGDVIPEASADPTIKEPDAKPA